MNHLIVIVLVTVACANAVLAQKQTSINPASIYHVGGVTVVSPNQPGWVLLQSNKSLIGFQKRGAGEVLNASVKTIRTKVFDNDNDLLNSLEALKVEELSKLKKVSVHFNYVRFKETPCVQYDGIFTGDALAPNLKYFNFKGYMCRYPESKGLVVQIELSNHSNLRGFSENLINLSNEFFERMAFSKVAGWHRNRINPYHALRHTLYVRILPAFTAGRLRLAECDPFPLPQIALGGRGR